jgi:hypothetical protein
VDAADTERSDPFSRSTLVVEMSPVLKLGLAQPHGNLGAGPASRGAEAADTEGRDPFTRSTLVIDMSPVLNWGLTQPHGNLGATTEYAGAASKEGEGSKEGDAGASSIAGAASCSWAANRGTTDHEKATKTTYRQHPRKNNIKRASRSLPMVTMIRRVITTPTTKNSVNLITVFSICRVSCAHLEYAWGGI